MWLYEYIQTIDFFVLLFQNVCTSFDRTVEFYNEKYFEPHIASLSKSLSVKFLIYSKNRER